MSKPRPIIVLGPERSGTSVLAEMICKWGAYPGDEAKLRSSDKHNLQGYWEYMPIWDFQAEMGVDWWEGGFQRRVKENASVPGYREKAESLVSEMEGVGKPWVWKDPALSFFLPFWQQVWGNAAYVIMVRNPLDTAVSWQNFILPESNDSVSLIAGNLLRWHYIMAMILENTEKTKEKIFISFEDLLREPRPQAETLCTFLSRVCEAEETDDVDIDAVAQAVNPKLWHNRSQVPFDEVGEASTELKRLYTFTLGKVRNPFERFEVDGYPICPGWREFVRNGETLARFYRAQT